MALSYLVHRSSPDGIVDERLTDCEVILKLLDQYQGFARNQNQTQQLPEPLKILFVCAGPENTSCIRLGEEIREIKSWIKSGPFRDRFSIADVFATRQNDLREALLVHKPHILHFSGHGSESGIILEDNSGNAYTFEFERLAKLLGAVTDNLRLVVLNACYSGLQADALRQTVDFVIGMNHKILDRSAIDFSAALYLSIGFNRSVQECFDLAVNALPTIGIPQAHIPALFSRDGIQPSRIYVLSWLDPKKPAGEPTDEDTEATIQIDIILLPHGTNNARGWRYACDHDREFFESLDEKKERLTPDLMWQRVTAETSKPKGGFRNARVGPADVFLVLRDNLILNLYAEQTLESIVNNLREASLGANFYVVCDQEAPFNLLYQKKYQSVVDRWFQMLIMSGVTDLIEMPKKHKSTQTSENEMLRQCANRSQERRQRLRKLVSTEGWVLELRPEALSLKLFLERFTEEALWLPEGRNLAVFYDQKPKFGWSELLKSSRQRNGSGKWFIGAHGRSDAKDLSDLKEMWIQESKDKTPEWFDGVIEFQGMFEWLYAICRVHLAMRLARLTSLNIASKAMF